MVKCTVITYWQKSIDQLLLDSLMDEIISPAHWTSRNILHSPLFFYLTFFFLAGAAQSKEIVFPPSKEPAFITIPGKSSTEPFSLVPGTWTVSIMAEEVLLVRKELRKTSAWRLSWWYCSGVICYEVVCKQLKFSTSKEYSSRISSWKCTVLPLLVLVSCSYRLSVCLESVPSKHKAVLTCSTICWTYMLTEISHSYISHIVSKACLSHKWPRL